MAKRTKFQAELLLRSRPPSAFDALREASERLKMTQSFPPGVIAAVGEILAGVLDEIGQVRAIKDVEKQAAPLEVAK